MLAPDSGCAEASEVPLNGRPHASRLFSYWQDQHADLGGSGLAPSRVP